MNTVTEQPVVAALQMTSVADVAVNLASAERLLREAAARGACVAVLPENFALMGLRDSDKLAVAETPGSGPIQERLAALARQLEGQRAGDQPQTELFRERG